MSRFTLGITILALFLIVAGPTVDAGSNLTLEEALQAAYHQHPALESAYLDLLSAEEVLRSARGVFDPTVTAGGDLGVTRTPDGTGDHSRTDSTDLGATLSGLVPWGTSYSLQLGGGRTETEMSGVAGTPLHSASAGASLHQPLLDGGWREANLAGVRLARLDRALAWSDLESRLASLIYQVTAAYWELAYAREDLLVAELSLERARDLLDVDERKVDKGVMAPVELLQPRLSVANRESELVSTRARLRTAEDSLLAAMGSPPESWEDSPAVTLPMVEGLTCPPLDQALQEARERNLELKRWRLLVERARRDLDSRRLTTLPGLDLTGSAGWSALEQESSDAVDHLWQEDTFSWSVGLELTVPLGNRIDSASVESRRLSLARSERTLEEAWLSVAAQLRRACRDLLAQQERVGITGRATELAQENLAAEEKRFELGVSTNFRLLDFQEELARAERAQARVLVDLALAGLELDHVTGRLPLLAWRELPDPMSPPVMPEWGPEPAP